MFITATFYFLFTLLLLYYTFCKSNKYKNFPPGPRPWPIIGNLLVTGKAHHLTMAKFSKQYGKIIGMQMGPDKAIYIHGAKLIREALAMPQFSGKFKREAATFLVGDGAGIIQSEGEIWHEQRRFAIRHLRDFGFGKSSMEDLIQENVNDLVEWLKQQNGRPISLLHRFQLVTINSLWQIISGQRFNHDDSQLMDIMNEFDRTVKTLLSFQSLKSLLIFYYPRIARMFPNWSGWARLTEEAKPRDKLLKGVIEEHVHTYLKGQPRDFVDTYLEEINKTTDTKSSFHPDVGYNSLKSVMADLFIAGSEPAATASTWAMLYLLHNPHVQVKLQAELDRVVGRNRRVCLGDRKSLPYTDAVVKETLRLASVSPVNLVHQCTEDVKFHGYDIPKGTHIFGNLYYSHHDPEVWGDPEVFRPERFLSPDETTVIYQESFLAFSTGRRACIGKYFALDSLFLCTANLAHNFHICPSEGNGVPGSSLNIKYGGLSLKPESSTMILKERLGNSEINLSQITQGFICEAKINKPITRKKSQG